MSASTGVELRNVTHKGERFSFGSSVDVGPVTPIYQEAIPPQALPIAGLTYASPGPASPSNEYDIIKDKSAGLRLTKRQQTENPLYGDHGTIPVAHPTLTVHDAKNNHDSKVSTTSITPSKSESPPARKNERGTCNCLLYALLLFTLLVAVAALVLAILLSVGIKPYGPTSSCSSCPATAPLTADQNISTLNTTVQNLITKVTSFISQVSTNQGQFSASILNNISRLTASGSVQNFSVCTTTNVATCFVNAAGLVSQSAASCNTSAVPMNINGNFTMNSYCSVTNSTMGGLSPIIATLIYNTTAGTLKCNCYIVNTPPSTLTTAISCGLFMTTCPRVSNASLPVRVV